MRPAISSSTVFSMLVLSAFPAYAAGAGAAGVMVFPIQPVYDAAPDDACARATEVIATELGNTDRLRTVPAPAIRKATAFDAPKVDHGAVGRATGLVRDGAERVAAQDFDKAVKALKQALSVLERNAVNLDDFKPLVDGYLYLSVAYIATGEEEAAEDLIKGIVRLDPRRRLEPGDFVPLYQRIFEKLRAAILAEPRGSILVRSSPSGAAIAIDGKEVGSTPALLTGVVRGEHFLRVGSPGGSPKRQTVAVPSGSQVGVNVEFSTLDGSPEAAVARAIRDNSLDAATRAQAARIARDAGAAYTVIGGMSKTNDTLLTVNAHLMRVADGAVTALVPVSLESDMLGAAVEAYKLAEDASKKLDAFPAQTDATALAVAPGARRPFEKTAEIAVGEEVVAKPEWERLTPERRPLPTPPDMEPPPDVKPPKPWYTNPWLWTAVGVVAVGSGVGTWIYVAGQSPDHGQVNATW
ncbi:MAG: PEGA domain-containing protein [Deltaproteobacteria bacterium]|nr:PEGA domain-containing protein [Deltaproteobacteria bacterium]